jgi:hypothetical protein
MIGFSSKLEWLESEETRLLRLMQVHSADLKFIFFQT